MLAELKHRISLLNIIRLVLGISLIGEGLHSQTFLLVAVGAVFLVQILLNKKCKAEGCKIEE